MADWLDLDGFKSRSVMPPEDVDRVEALYIGFASQALKSAQAWIESRLRKRYALPFNESSVPETLLAWLTSIVTLQVYQRRGWNPSSAENQLIVDAASTAKSEIKEAADSKDGLFDLPLRDDAPNTSGISVGGPLGYTETSPYQWTDLQVEDGRREDTR